MYRFFSSVVSPLLDAAAPSVVVEIGSDNGHGTELLAGWCHQHGAVLHVVDPLPKYETEEWEGRWPGTIRFHLDLSLNALVDIGAADVVCIDGDHNWYTVFHELEMLGRSAATAGRSFPLTLLHDVGWPYGRRDLYYDPSTIPESHRHPYRTGGLAVGRRSVADQGFNDHLANAIHEGTPRNGVLTAVEDFVDQHSGDLRLHVLPGIHGLGIVHAADADVAVLDAVAEVTGASGLRRLLDAVEQDRVARLEALAAVQREATRSRRLLDRASDEVALQGKAMRRLEAELDEARAIAVDLEATQAKLEAARAQIDALQRRVEDTDGHLERTRSQLDQAQQGLATTRRELDTARDDLAARTDDALAARRGVAAVRRDYDRLRKRRSVRLALWFAQWSRPLFRIRRGQSRTSASAREDLAKEGPRSRRGALSSAPAVTGTGMFYDSVREVVASGVKPEFVAAWEASEAAVPKEMAGSAPLVSIIMPTHNRAGIIGDAITSVIEQTYPHWELLVCDDASRDGTAEVVRAFGDDRIVYRRLRRGGAARARNAGIAAASGELIAYLDSDNIWHPRLLDTLVPELVARPGVHGVYAKYLDVKYSPHPHLSDFSDRPFDYDRLSTRNYIDLNTFVHRRRLYEQFDGFDERLARQQDWDLILKYSFLRDPVYVDRFLALYRRNDAWDQITKVARSDRNSPVIIGSSVEGYYRNGLPRRKDAPGGARLAVLSWDVCRNHFSKAYNIAEAVAGTMPVELVGFRFFEGEVFPPYAAAEPSFPVRYLPGGEFPGWQDSLARAVAAVGNADVAYAVKPRLPSLGVALLANYHFGTPVVLEANDLETVVTSPRPGQRAQVLRPSDVDPGDPGLLNPYGPTWTAIMEYAAAQVPTRVTHNSELDRHFGGGAFFLRNPKDERHFDPTRHDREQVRRRLGFVPGERVILFGGMVRRHKGVFELTRLLEDAASPYRLLVVGSRTTPDQEALARQARGRVTIVDPLDRNEMAAVNLACDAVVLWLDPDVPASRYQMPYKLTDPLAMRLPVVANDIGDLGDLARQGFLRLARFGDIAALRATLDDIFTDREATAAMVDAGRRLYLRQFSYAAVRSTMALVVDDALRHAGPLPVAAEVAELLSAFLGRLPGAWPVGSTR